MPEQNPYEFITDPAQPAKKPLIAADSAKSRILVVLGGLVALLVIGLIVMAIISSLGGGGKEALLKAAQQQAELIRISKIGIERARGAEAKNLATTVSLSLTTDQVELNSVFRSAKVKISNKQLAAGKNQQTDTLLTNAEQANKFDEVFIQTVKSMLVNYQKTLKSAHDATSNAKVKEMLATQFHNAGLLTKNNE